MSMQRATLIELAEAARHAGFQYITARAKHFADEPLSGSRLRRRIEECGVKVSVIDGLRTALPGVPDDPNLPRLTDYVRMAHSVGASCINVLHYGGTPQPIELLAEALSKVCRTAAAEGLDLCVEFIPGTGIPDLKTCLEILQLTRHSNAGVLLDSWHFARSGGKPHDIDSQTAKLIRSVQLSDRTPDQDLLPYMPMSGRKIPGRGTLPLAQMIAPVLAAHPELPIGAEVISDEMEAMAFENAALILARSLREVISEAQR